jgi:hypothetical protein
MRAIVRVDVSDIAPVSAERPVIVREIVGKHAGCSYQVRKKILSKFVTAIEISSVTEQGLSQGRRVEYINSHAGKHH